MALPLLAIKILGTGGAATALGALYQYAKTMGVLEEENLNSLKRAGKYAITDMPGDVAEAVDSAVSTMIEVAPDVLYQLGGGDDTLRANIENGRAFFGLPKPDFPKSFPSQGNMFTGNRGPDGSLKTK